ALYTGASACSRPTRSCGQVCPRSRRHIELAPVADQDEGGPEVWVRVRRGFVSDDEIAAYAALRGCACVCLCAAQQRELRLPQGFGFERAHLCVAQLIEILHQQARAAIRDRPETGDDRFRALPLRKHGEAFDLFAVRASAAV